MPFNKESVIITSLAILFATSVLFSALQYRAEKNTDSTNLAFSQNGIAVIDLYGPISFSSPSQSFMPEGAEATLQEIRDISEDKHVKGVLIRINSPGGPVGASQELHQALIDLKKKRHIPIVASIGDLGASGAYYTAIAADTIFANPGSLVGSIGVILGNVNFSDLAQKYGVDYQVYKSGPYKDILSSWRDASPQEQQLLQGLISNVYEQFATAVATDRKLPIDIVHTLSQGQIYTGEQAKANHLIDELGGYNEAITYLGLKAGLTGKPIIISKSKGSWDDIFGRWKNYIGSSVKESLMSGPSLEFR